MAKIWFCKIGEVESLPEIGGADLPMRKAVEQAYRELTGEEPVFTFSGWGAELEEIERAVVEDREPVLELTSSATKKDLQDALDAIDVIMGLDKGPHEEEWIEWCNKYLPLMKRNGRRKHTLEFI